MIRNLLLLNGILALVLPFFTASATSLSVLINDNGMLQLGDKVFSNFSATPQNTIDPAIIDVTTMTSSVGNLGLRFAPGPALSIAAQGVATSWTPILPST